MAEAKPLSQIYPGKGLGWITLGASLHGILTRLKAQPQLYPQINLSYSSQEPIQEPIILTLSANGVRLRFDGPDQRLRLIEIIDFSKTTFTYKNTELVRRPVPTSNERPLDPVPIQGPSFRHIYNRLFGPAYAGEYIPAGSGHLGEIYVLSYPGLAATFPLKPKSWSEKVDFVSLLSTAASPATSLAIFTGSSWPEVRNTLFTAAPMMPRSIALANKMSSEATPDEIEQIIIHGGGRLDLTKRTSPTFSIQLNETTPQDLVAELGPPDAIFRKNSTRLSIQASSQPRHSRISPALEPSSVITDHPSSRSVAEDDSESDANADTGNGSADNQVESFYNYFHHGFDVLISQPRNKSTPFPGQEQFNHSLNHFIPNLTATKIFLHSNIPGSYSFNRHRRSRWTILIPDHPSITSEMRFTEISSILKDVWKHSYSSADEEVKMQRGMVLNRGWGEEDSPESSVELLGGFERDTSTRAIGGAPLGDHGSTLSNTQLFGFPGMLFEVLKNDVVSCVTIY